MTTITSPLLHHFCLICSQFSCQSEALHHKITLYQLQQLLLTNTLLSFTSSSFTQSHSVYTIIPQNHNKTLLSGNLTNFNSLPLASFSHPQPFASPYILSEFFSQSRSFKPLHKSIHSFIIASLTLIELMTTIRSNSLLYHDVMQILKYIAFLQFDPHSQTLTEHDLPFTQNRIQRTVKQLKQKILLKEKEAKMIKQKGVFLNIDQSNILRDLTNQPSNQNKIKKQNQKSKQCSVKFDDTSILKEILERTQFYQKFAELIESHSKNYFVHESPENSLNLSMEIINRIEELEIHFMQTLENKENEEPKFSTYQKESEKENDETLKHSLNPEKSAYPIAYHFRNPQKSSNIQIPELGEFAYIEGLPFPTNRRSIDFSLLELTDDLLLSYIPALDKLKDLEEICIRKNKLSVIGYRLIKNLFPHLHSIDLRANTITPEIVEVLLDFKQLNILYLSECKIQPASLVKICLNLEGVNILYCDRINFDDCTVLGESGQKRHESLMDLRGIFYIMSLNLKKLMFFSIKGCFSPEITQYEALIKTGCERQLKHLPDFLMKEIGIISKISETLRKRHGILEF